MSNLGPEEDATIGSFRDYLAGNSQIQEGVIYNFNDFADQLARAFEGYADFNDQARITWREGIDFIDQNLPAFSADSAQALEDYVIAENAEQGKHINIKSTAQIQDCFLPVEKANISLPFPNYRQISEIFLEVEFYFKVEVLYLSFCSKYSEFLFSIPSLANVLRCALSMVSKVFNLLWMTTMLTYKYSSRCSSRGWYFR